MGRSILKVSNHYNNQNLLVTPGYTIGFKGVTRLISTTVVCGPTYAHLDYYTGYLLPLSPA